MAKKIEDWIATDVAPFRDKSVRWLSEAHFFRDPSRPYFSDTSYFLAPADGILLYQREVEPDECIVDIKGKAYSLRDALRDPTYSQRSLVIGIFMTFFDVHVNRVPYPGRIHFRELEPIDTYNHPMLEVERQIINDLRVSTDTLGYLHHNQRVVNRIDSLAWGGSYYVLQIADYDVDCITPFNLKQGQPYVQGERFSQIRYGSQVDLIVPLRRGRDLITLQATGTHVEGGLDPLIEVRDRTGNVVQPTPFSEGRLS
ncbi:MAG: phosphatidylserine decarboxylase [Candidatus Eiseniibacteriota bacterium]